MRANTPTWSSAGDCRRTPVRGIQPAVGLYPTTPQNDAGRITERFSRPTFARMDIDVTIEDAKAYTRPFTVRLYQELMLDEELIEFVCLENPRVRR